MTGNAPHVSPLFQRVKRPRKNPPQPATPEDRLVDEALAVWVQWLREYLLPRDSTHRVKVDGSTFEAATNQCFARAPSRGVSNPTLSAVLADERNLVSWPKTIHALITDLPRGQRCALLGNALGYSQTLIAQHMGISQPRVCIALQLGRRTLGIQLAVMRHVQRADRSIARKREG